MHAGLHIETLVIQNKRDVSTNIKQIYFRHAIKQAFRGEVETYPLYRPIYWLIILN
jgi:hypothetical protein